ncbi:hypothetical protein FACS189490_10990 [Clostridia bacterium]|nr:hypothetical protein FACS189490_10990 [Clostridia bacterium]
MNAKKSLNGKFDVSGGALWTGKAFVAGAAAFLVLNLFCVVYYNIPFRTYDTQGMTEYNLHKGSFHSQLTESFGYGVIDKNGYNNAENLAEVENPQVLIMGSSHIAALYIPQNKNATYILDDLLRNIGFNAYAVGISAHSLTTLSKHLPNALDVIKPLYVVLETGTVNFSDKLLENYMSDSLPLVRNREQGGLAQLTQILYLRLIRFQLGNIIRSNAGENEQETETHNALPSTDLLQKFTDKINGTATKHGAKPIIFYHPRLIINADGTVTPSHNNADINDFSDACAASGIEFIDMTQTFIDAYYNEHILPHGFFNTEIGTGHLNEYGHKMVAEKLAEKIIALEGEK